MFCVIILTLYFGSIARAMGQTATVGITPSATTNVYPGDEVTVNVTVTNMPSPGIYSYELKLYYNNTLLEVKNAEIPPDHMLKPTLKPGNIFIVDSGTDNQTEGYVMFAVTLLTDEPGKTGNGTLTTITFEGLARGTATLEIRDIILVDPNAVKIPETDYNLQTGSITIIPEFTVAVLITAFLITSIAMVALRKKLK